MRKLKPAKPKAVNFELIPPMDNGHEPEPYAIMREVRKKYHEQLFDAKIALAWRKSLKKDRDGHLMLGKCIKASDLQKEFAEYDYVILLNREVWLDSEFTPAKKRALVDHELCHAHFAPDKDGFKKRDERGRVVWRVRKHDIEEFVEIVQRHGCYKRDLEHFAEALLKKRATPPLLQGLEPVKKEDPTPVPVEVTVEELARTRKAKKKIKLQGQDAILHDKRTSFPHGQNADTKDFQ